MFDEKKLYFFGQEAESSVRVLKEEKREEERLSQREGFFFSREVEVEVEKSLRCFSTSREAFDFENFFFFFLLSLKTPLSHPTERRRRRR